MLIKSLQIQVWILQDIAVPTRVVATSEPYDCGPQTEDTITFLVDRQSIKSKNHKGTAVYTASWTAPSKSGVHSAQHWYYMAEKVERLLTHVTVYFDFREKSMLTKLIVGTTSPSMTAVKLGSTHSGVYSFIPGAPSESYSLCIFLL